jgi:hypothetical protein
LLPRETRMLARSSPTYAAALVKPEGGDAAEAH